MDLSNLMLNAKYCSGGCLKLGVSCFPNVDVKDGTPSRDTICDEAYSRFMVAHMESTKPKVRIVLKELINEKAVLR
jgi:hypothetical protein